MSSPIPVVRVVDDDADFRSELCGVLNLHGFCIEPFASADDLLLKAQWHVPGCIILDLMIPGLTGLELQAKLLARRIRMPLIFLSGHIDIQSTVAAMKAGAIDFLTKPVEQDCLVAAVKHAIATDLARLALEAARQQILVRASRLTPRETEVLTMVVNGFLNKQIADTLDISEWTVKVHRRRVMNKMQVESVAHLVRAAAEARLELPPVPRRRPNGTAQRSPKGARTPYPTTWDAAATGDIAV